jgi:hypothetical protein
MAKCSVAFKSSLFKFLNPSCRTINHSIFGGKFNKCSALKKRIARQLGIEIFNENLIKLRLHCTKYTVI